ALIRGAPLEDVGEAPFAAAEAARLEELEIAARESLLEAGLGPGAVAELEQLIARRPYRERLRGLLMLALYRSGRQADALAAYRAARATLADELGIEPGDDIQELERAILRQDPALRGPSAEAPPATPAPRRAGRKTVTVAVTELALSGADPEALRSLLDRAREIAERHGGSLLPRGGSSVALVFGVPVVHEDDAVRAARAAAELRDCLADLEPRTGVATGEVYVDAEQAVTGEPLSSAEQFAQSARAGEILLAPETSRLVELHGDGGRRLRLDSPLVGRERQLQTLRSAFANAVADETCHLFTVLGAAGVGKSRLVGELTAGLDATIVRGRCLPYGEGVTLWALQEMGVEPGEARGTFEGLARERPLVAVFDNLHWAEPELLDLVEDIAGSRGAPILLVCLARPELLEARPGWGGGRINAASVLLEPLSDEESGRLIDNLLGPSDLPQIVRDWIVSTAEGN